MSKYDRRAVRDGPLAVRDGPSAGQNRPLVDQDGPSVGQDGLLADQDGRLADRDGQMAGLYDRQAVPEGPPVAERPGRLSGPEDRCAKNVPKMQFEFDKTAKVFLIAVDTSTTRDLSVHIADPTERLTYVLD